MVATRVGPHDAVMDITEVTTTESPTAGLTTDATDPLRLGGSRSARDAGRALAAVAQAAAESGGEQPQIPDAGPPHLVHGMVAELTVDAA